MSCVCWLGDVWMMMNGWCVGFGYVCDFLNFDGFFDEDFFDFGCCVCVVCFCVGCGLC